MNYKNPITGITGKDRAMQRCNPSSPGPCGESPSNPAGRAGPGRQAEKVTLAAKLFTACHPFKPLHTGFCVKPVFEREKGN